MKPPFPRQPAAPLRQGPPPTGRAVLLRPVLAVLLSAALWLGAPPVGAQTPKSAPDGDVQQQRLEVLEAEYLDLKNEVNLLRERLEALLGPDTEERIYEFSVGNSPIRGNPDAPLTLIEFGDFQSYYAARARHVVSRLLEEYPDSLRFVFKHFPLTTRHPQANEASLAVLAAEKQGHPWEMHDLLFQNTRRLEPNLYLMLAQQLGLDLAQFDQDRRSLWALERLAADEKEAVRAGVNAVPTFFLNGARLRSWRYDFIKTRIDELLKPFKGGAGNKKR